jgi:hypothetical protein
MTKMSFNGHPAVMFLRYSRAAATHAVGAANAEEGMLWTVAMVLFVLWALGMVSSYTMNGFIHILLVLAIVTVLVRIIQGQRPV